MKFNAKLALCAAASFSLFSMNSALAAKGDVIFDDFESGTYEKWTVEGKTFGEGPIHKKDIPKYQKVNLTGNYCINGHASAPGSLAQKDKTTGKMISKSFTINHDYLSVDIFGGNNSKLLGFHLVIDGKVVEKAVGINSNSLQKRSFNLKKYKGKTAHFEIVDNHKGGWGFIGVDNIVFTNKKPRIKRTGKITQSQRKDAFSPASELESFELPEGFVAELVASEEHGVVNPIDLSFDDAGRMWLQTASMYPLDPANVGWNQLLKLMDNKAAQLKNPEFKRILDLYTGKTKGKDKVLIIDDLYKPAPAKVFADGLAIPQSVVPYKDGAFVAHCAQMIFLNDSDKDGKADERKVILDGFGFTDTHTMAHSLIRGPGSYIYFSHGALNKGLVTAVASGVQKRIDYQKTVRFSLDGKKLEVVASGLNNNWGINLRGKGQWYGTEANDLGWSIVPIENGTGFKGIGNERLRSYQPWFPAAHSFRVGGTGLSGAAFSDDVAGGFPDEYKDVAFLANPITSTINAVKIVRNPDGTVTAKHLEDFLFSGDEWFRPVNVEFGPDGCLYVVDWYNKVISHNEVSREHPDRDRTHGRIWRIRHKSQNVQKCTNFITVPTNKLVKKMKTEGTVWAKRAAWHQIADRQAKELAPELIELIADKSADETTRITALWSLESLKVYNDKLYTQLLSSETPWELRREAVRALKNMPITPSKLAKVLKPFLNEKNVMIRTQVIRTINDFGKSNADLIDILVSFCQPDSKSESLGGDYERKQERFLARMALESYAVELGEYLESPLAKKQAQSHLDWAAKALTGSLDPRSFLQAWKKDKDKKVTVANIKQMSQILSDKSVYNAVKPAFDNKANANETLKAALTYRSAIQSKELEALLKTTIKNSSDKVLALAAATQFNDQSATPLALEALKSSTDRQQLIDATILLSKEAKKHQAVLEKLFKTTGDSYLKSLAFQALAKAQAAVATAEFKAYVSSLSDGEKVELIFALSEFKEGAQLLAKSYENKSLASADLQPSVVKDIAQFVKGQPAFKTMQKDASVKESAAKKAFAKKLHKYEAIVKKNIGKAPNGKALFQALCLSCHVVGSEGAAFAPALDGSGHRDMEGLLTAILDPDIAAEGSYYRYKVVKIDGSTIEGYRETHNAKGVTLRFMGGAKIFIPQSEIRRTYFTSQSVMPAGLVEGLGEQQFADLIAYIKSLK